MVSNAKSKNSHLLFTNIGFRPLIAAPVNIAQRPFSIAGVFELFLKDFSDACGGQDGPQIDEKSMQNI